jgi:hypothetical protein
MIIQDIPLDTKRRYTCLPLWKVQETPSRLARECHEAMRSRAPNGHAAHETEART